MTTCSTAHIGAMDTMALALKVAARMIEAAGWINALPNVMPSWNGELGHRDPEEAR